MHELLQDRSASEFLKKSAAVYEKLADRVLNIYRRGDHARALLWIQLAASFAWMFHPGRFADGRIENVAFEIGRELGSLPQRPSDAAAGERSSECERRRVLHVATAVGRIGGHTRLLANWIENDGASRHSLLLLYQRDLPVPEWLRQASERSGGTVSSLQSDLPLLEKAKRLREIASAEADLVVLHQNPDDVVPIIAFAPAGGPPVAVMNHADHVFWLGSSVADVVINIRGFGKRISEERRFARHTMLLPIPLGAVSSGTSRAEARRRLGIGETEVVMLSVGNVDKYTPTRTHNFFKTIGKILERHKAAHLYLVGVRGTEKVKHLREFSHERAHLLGPLDDPTPYYQAADLYLEGFPYGSQTALLEAAMMGVCPVLMYAPIPQADMSEDVGFDGIVKGAEHEEEYIAHVSSLLEDPDKRERLGEGARARVVSSHRGETWQKYLLKIYECLEAKSHDPSMIPQAVCAHSEDDLGLSAFQMKQHRGSLLQMLVDQNFNRLSFRDMMWLFFLSYRMRDDAFSYAEQSVWVGLFKAKALKKRGAVF